MTYARSLILALILIISGTVNAAEVLRGELSHSSYEIHFEQDTITAGRQHWMAVRITPREGWHTYWVNPGDSGATPYFSWTTPKSVSVGTALFGAPERLPVGPLMNYGYHSASTILFPVTVDKSHQNGELTISADIEWLVCEIECVPQVDSWAFSINAVPSSTETKELFSDARASLPEPSYWDSNLTISNNSSDLLVFADKSDVPNIAAAYFFPLSEGIVNYAADQNWLWTEHGLELSFEKSAGMPIPESGSGVLKLMFEDGSSQAFELEANLTLNIRGASTESNIQPAAFTMPIWQAAIFALIGGLILNLMPCVFPVLSLKAFALVSANYKSQSNRRKEGWAYTLGIWSSFMAIVAVLVTLKAGGSAIGWGFQLQEPLFIGFLILLMVLVSLSLAGVFYINTGMEGAGQSLTLREGASGSFAKGVLATLVATPCTAPFMAPAIGYALTQPVPVIFFIFSMLALGLALPFLALSYSDKLAQMMPRPGTWMEKVKQGLAFPMLLTAAWLLYVYGLQAGNQAALFMMVSAITLSFGVWLYQQTNGPVGRVFAGTAMIGALVIAISVSETKLQTTTVTDGSKELSYSEETLAETLDKGEPVFVYFTAEWCITCKVNEQVALFTDEVQQAIVRNDINVIKGDWTNRNAEIAEILAKHGRAGVPLYLYFSKNSNEPKVLPEILTKDILLDYFLKT